MVAELLDIPLGSIVIFEGDVYHRSLSFPEESHALHVYLDVPEVEREKDYIHKGWLLHPCKGACILRTP